MVDEGWVFNRLAVGVFVDSKFCTCHAIERGDEILVVLHWLGNPKLGLRKPEYVLPLDQVRHQKSDDPKAPAQYLINDPMPKSLFDGTAKRPERRRWKVQKGPDVTFPLDHNIQ